MGPVHIHLLTNHIPILGTLFGVLILAAGIFVSKPDLRVAGMVTLIIVSFSSIPAYFSGEESEHIIEHLEGISHAYLEEHEDLAKPAMGIALSTGVLALISLILGALKKGNQKLLSILVLILGILSFSAMSLVGAHGGKIRHTEIIAPDDHHLHQEHDH